MRRVVVTGMGAITPMGLNVKDYFENVKAGNHGFGKITKFDTSEYKAHVAAEVKGFVAKEFMDFKAAKRMEPFSQYAVAAAKEAMEQAGLDMEKEDAYRVGCSIGSGIGSLEVIEREHTKLNQKGPNRVNPLMVPLMIETLAKKLEEAAWIPAPLVKAKVFGKQFHTVCSGGAYLNPAYLEMFKKYGITIWQGYGMTECSPVISTNYGDFMKDGSVGRLMPNCEAKVVDEELWVRGSSVMQGYYQMPKETEETLVDGWLRTGDLGYVDEEGFVYLTGRKKNLIITKNGENVSPEELENRLSEAPIIQEVLVRESEGVIEAEIFPDAEYVEKKGVQDVRAALQELIDDWNKNAPAYKKIYRLKVRETEFPKTPSKKIKRY